MNGRRQPVLGFVGIHAGRRRGQPVSQNETLALLFETMGYQVRLTSSVKRPWLRTADQVLSMVRWRDVDAVVVAVFSGPSFWIADFSSLLARWFGRKKVILFMHGGNLPVYGPAHEARVRRVFDRADLLLAPSAYIADVFRPWGYDVRIIPNVLSIDRYRYDRRSAARPALLWMRTFHHHYHPELAIDILARVVAVHPGAILTMGGSDRGLLTATRARAVALGVVDRVRFGGYLDAAAKADAFADHDIFLSTNRIDNMPVSLLEAAASGLVPVATSVGGIPALLTDDQNGVLVEAENADAMADAVLALLTEPDRYARLSAGARALAEESAWPAVHARWRDQLSTLLPAFVLP